jgi:hypothetical protein
MFAEKANNVPAWKCSLRAGELETERGGALKVGKIEAVGNPAWWQVSHSPTSVRHGWIPRLPYFTIYDLIGGCFLAVVFLSDTKIHD